MPLRINLLPEYVRLERRFKRIAAACVAIFACVALVLFALYYKQGQNLATLQVNLDNIDAVAKQAESVAAEAKAANAASAPKRGAVEFAVAASRTGAERAALLELISRYIYGEAVVNSLDISDGQNVTIHATVRNPDQYARLLNNLRRGSDANGGPLFAGLPAASGVPGFPPPRPGESGAQQNQAGGEGQPGQPTTALSANQPSIIVFPVGVTATAVLKYPVQLPADPANAAPAGAAGGAEVAPGEPPPP